MILEHLVKEAGSGSGWRTFHSFLCTQVVKEFTRLWRQKHEGEMWRAIRNYSLLLLLLGRWRKRMSLRQCGLFKWRQKGWKHLLKEKKKKRRTLLQILTITVVAVSRREFDSHNLLQVVCHAHSSEWWSEVNLTGLSLRTIRVISHLVSSSDVLHHSWSKEERNNWVKESSFPICSLYTFFCASKTCEKWQNREETETKWEIWPVYIWKYRIHSCCDNAILNDTEWTNALHVMSVSTTDTSQPAHHWPLSGFILLLLLVEGLRFYTGVNSFALFASHIRHDVKTKVKSKPNLLGYTESFFRLTEPKDMYWLTEICEPFLASHLRESLQG